MSANIVRVSGDYKIQAAQGGSISLDAGTTGNVNVVGNLTVTGNTTSLITTNTNITDNIIFLNKETDPNHNGVTLEVAGIEIDRGTHTDGDAQIFFDETLSWEDPVSATLKHGLFVFKTSKYGINGIRTNSIDTSGGNLNLINFGNGVISVAGTSNYERHVTDDDHIPNKKYVVDYVNLAITGGGNLTITQPAHYATLTIADYKTFIVNNTLTFTGTDSSSIAFGSGGTVLYNSSTLDASKLSGTITGTVLGNSTLYIGTTSIALNRSSDIQSLTGISIDGNAETATKLATAVNINGTPFDGSANVTVTASAETLTGTVLKSTIVTSSLTSVGTLLDLIVTNTITGSVSGNASTVTNGVYTTGSYADPVWITSLAYSKLTGIPSLASYLTLLSLSVDTPGSPSGDGSLAYDQNTGKFKYTPPDLSSYLTATSTATLINKTFDTAGTGNVLKINGTQVSNITGTGKIVLDNSPTLITPTLGAATATSINGLTISTSTGTLTIIDGKTLTTNNTLTFTGTDTSTVAFGTGGTVTYTSNKLNVFSATSSSELAGIISDETGTGLLVFNDSPTLITPTIGVATATTVNKVTITAPANGSTLTIIDGKTLTASNTLTFTGTDGSSVAFGTGGTVTYTSNKLNVFSATSSSELAGVISDETGTGLLVFNNSPTLITPTLGAATATTINGLTISTSTGTLTIIDGKTLTASNTLTFTGTDTSTVAFGTGGTVTYTRNKLSVFSATSSSELAGIISDETGTGLLVFNDSPTIAGHPTIEGITSTGATGTGNLVYSISPSLTGTATIATLNLTNALGIAYGGTNQTTYTAPVSSINPIVYYDGTRFQTNALAADVGYNPATDNFFTRNITTVSLSAQSTSGGSLIQIQTDPGAAMISGNRLGGIFFGGSSNNTHTIQNRTSIESFATQNWTVSNQGAKIVFSTTQNNSNSRSAALTLDQDQSATFAGHLTVEGVTSTGATGTGKFVFDTAPTISGHPTIEGVTSTGATGTGKFVFDTAPTISGHPTIEGVTSTGATGTGRIVFDGSPTLITPTLGAATATTINGLTISTSTGTLTIANGKTLTASNTLTFTGTDTSTVAFGDGGTVTYTRNKLSVFSATSSSELAGVISDETGTGLLVFGTSPTISTSLITDSTSFNLINTTATTVNFAKDATTISVGSTTGKIIFNSTDNSTSMITGALVVSGGVGIAKDVYVGGITTMLYQTSNPTADTGGVKVYAKNSDLGNTGIYYVNSTTSGELVSKRKALAYSIVFG